MSKNTVSEILNGSSVSVIIKNDSIFETSSIRIEQDEVDAYDLESQKPSERQRIINDNSFFKKLSHKFYSDRKPNSKSLSALPIEQSVSKFQSILAEPRKYESLNLLSDETPKTDRHASQKGMGRMQSSTDLKIKNFDAIYGFSELLSGKSKSNTPAPAEKKESPASARKSRTNRDRVTTVSIELLKPKITSENENTPLNAKPTAKMANAPSKIIISTARNSQKAAIFEYTNANNLEKKLKPSNNVTKIASPRSSQLPKNTLTKTNECFSAKLQQQQTHVSTPSNTALSQRALKLNLEYTNSNTPRATHLKKQTPNFALKNKL